MCNSASCGHGADWDAVIRTLYSVDSSATDRCNQLVVLSRPSDIDWAKVAAEMPNDKPRIGKPKRDKARTRMEKMSRRKNRP